jgi:hypothetical protein
MADGAAAAAPAAAPPARALLGDFLQIQERRAQLYAAYRAAFRAYLQSRQEAPFKRAVAALTGEFCEASGRVRALEACLAAPAAAGGAARPDLAALLRRVQRAEADKLRLGAGGRSRAGGPGVTL